jgi:glycosyltransferase involved in cell wall biosynthesis
MRKARSLNLRYQPCAASAPRKARILAVLYANPDYYPPTINAVRIWREHFSVHFLCRNMDKPAEDWPPDVIIERVGQYASARDKESARPLYKIVEYLQFVLALLRTIRIVNPNIIYAYDVHGLAGAFLAIGLSTREVPIVFHCHDHVEVESMSATSLGTWIATYAMHRARDAALVVYPEKHRARHYMQTTGDKRPPMIVPNCASLTLISRPADFAALIEYRWHNREILFTSGNIGEGVGAFESVQALAMLGNRFDLRVFGIFRPLLLRDRLMEVARWLGVERQTICEGFVPLKSVISQTMRSSVGLVLYHPVEFNLKHLGSASNKLFEYAARGIPAVVPDREDFRELLADESWVVYADPTSPRSIADAVGRIFADRARYSAMCYAARQAFEEKYNYEHVFAPVVDRMLDLAGGRGYQRLATLASIRECDIPLDA